ncbi:lysozyme [Lepeophtheirus salmonis]|uniref:lysozyme n=1 Tax=Lepeophtheirus salmonis TaxID=72036 RepID=UPI001AE8E417|nr:invertebrate-type lysozyme 3-like [Lepeophtheirus salmonis]
MRTYSKILISAAIVLFATVIFAEDDYVCDDSNSAVTNNCMGCICQASSSCNQTIGCISGNSLCGPFLISKPFWLDAGACALNGDNPSSPTAYINCANDIACAAKTIRSYVNRFQKDCNGDQVETCEDFAMIHKNGGWNCGNNIDNTDYGMFFTECKDNILSSGGSL